MYLVRWVSCPRLESHDHNCHIANLAAGANVGEKEEQGGGGSDRNPQWSLVERRKSREEEEVTGILNDHWRREDEAPCL